MAVPSFSDINSNSSGTSSVSSINTSLNTVGANSIIVATVTFTNGTFIDTLSDDQGNTYSLVHTFSTTGITFKLWTAVGITTNAATTITAARNSGTAIMFVTVWGVIGADQTTPIYEIKGTTTVSGTFGNQYLQNDFTPTGTNDLILSALVARQVRDDWDDFTYGAGQTLLYDYLDGSNFSRIIAMEENTGGTSLDSHTMGKNFLALSSFYYFGFIIKEASGGTPTNIKKIQIGGAWKDIVGIKINKSNIWKDVEAIQTQQGGNWKTN